MKKIGITGQPGFIGTHLYNYLSQKKNEVELIPFKDEYFTSKKELENFVRQCDVIVHLAAMNRHRDPQVIYDTNMKLVGQLINALDKTGDKPQILFSSSIQETNNNAYGRSKREGRKLLEKWARQNDILFNGLIIPNVFGPFGRPYYNSVVATFCHQLAHDEQPKVEIDASIKLIYINDLLKIIYNLIRAPKKNPIIKIQATAEKKVSTILKKINKFKSLYKERNIIPILKNNFDVSLFNTYRCYIDHEHYPIKLEIHKDKRGYLTEVLKTEIKGQLFYSSTRPGITRGNHFHIRKIERFCVLEREALIRLRKIGSDKIINYKVSGKSPSVIDIPIWHTHNITNTSKKKLTTLFWTNEYFNPEDPDTYYEEV